MRPELQGEPFVVGQLETCFSVSLLGSSSACPTSATVEVPGPGISEICVALALGSSGM